MGDYDDEDYEEELEEDEDYLEEEEEGDYEEEGDDDAIQFTKAQKDALAKAELQAKEAAEKKAAEEAEQKAAEEAAAAAAEAEAEEKPEEEPPADEEGDGAPPADEEPADEGEPPADEDQATRSRSSTAKQKLGDQQPLGSIPPLVEGEEKLEAPPTMVLDHRTSQTEMEKIMRSIFDEPQSLMHPQWAGQARYFDQRRVQAMVEMGIDPTSAANYEGRQVIPIPTAYGESEVAHRMSGIEPLPGSSNGSAAGDGGGAAAPLEIPDFIQPLNMRNEFTEPFPSAPSNEGVVPLDRPPLLRPHLMSPQSHPASALSHRRREEPARISPRVKSTRHDEEERWQRKEDRRREKEERHRADMRRKKEEDRRPGEEGRYALQARHHRDTERRETEPRKDRQEPSRDVAQYYAGKPGSKMKSQDLEQSMDVMIDELRNLRNEFSAVNQQFVRVSSSMVRMLTPKRSVGKGSPFYFSGHMNRVNADGSNAAMPSPVSRGTDNRAARTIPRYASPRGGASPSAAFTSAPPGGSSPIFQPVSRASSLRTAPQDTSSMEASSPWEANATWETWWRSYKDADDWRGSPWHGGSEADASIGDHPPSGADATWESWRRTTRDANDWNGWPNRNQWWMRDEGSENGLEGKPSAIADGAGGLHMAQRPVGAEWEAQWEDGPGRTQPDSERRPQKGTSDWYVRGEGMYDYNASRWDDTLPTHGSPSPADQQRSDGIYTPTPTYAGKSLRLASPYARPSVNRYAEGPTVQHVHSQSPPPRQEQPVPHVLSNLKLRPPARSYNERQLDPRLHSPLNPRYPHSGSYGPPSSRAIGESPLLPPRSMPYAYTGSPGGKRGQGSPASGTTQHSHAPPIVPAFGSPTLSYPSDPAQQRYSVLVHPPPLALHGNARPDTAVAPAYVTSSPKRLSHRSPRSIANTYDNAATAAHSAYRDDRVITTSASPVGDTRVSLRSLHSIANAHDEGGYRDVRVSGTSASPLSNTRASSRSPTVRHSAHSSEHTSTPTAHDTHDWRAPRAQSQARSSISGTPVHVSRRGSALTSSTGEAHSMHRTSTDEGASNGDTTPVAEHMERHWRKTSRGEIPERKEDRLRREGRQKLKAWERHKWQSEPRTSTRLLI
eukprot:GEMP01003634.1.p1 GENE.GEMP01003634.1~~GEMP01003634.1.p1  ORF type:complete len:1119 (+),score=330.45 GEMP01003634.1:565-3921(+)